MERKAATNGKKKKGVEPTKDAQKKDGQKKFFKLNFKGGGTKEKKKTSKKKKEKSIEEIMEEEKIEERKRLKKEAQNKFKLGLAAADADHEKALEYFNESLAAEEDLDGLNSAGVALVYEKIADIHKEQQDLVTAVQNYEKALDIFHRLETGENFKTTEDRQNLLEMRARCKKSLNKVNAELTGSGDVPLEITLDSSNNSRVRKPLSRQYYNLLSDHSTTASMSTATGNASIFSDNWSLMTPQSNYPLSKKKVHPREEEKLGDKEEDGGDLTKALTHYMTALSVLKRRRKPSSNTLLRVQIKIADTMFRNGLIYQGVKVYGQIADYLEDKRNENVFFLKVMVPSGSRDTKIADDFLRGLLITERKGDKAFKLGMDNGNFSDAATYYNRALKLLYKDKTLKPGNKHILRIHVKLGNIKWMMDESGTIVKAYDKAVSYFERKGDSLVEKKDNNNAIYCYCQALRFHFKMIRPESDIIIKIQVKIAKLFFEEGESLSSLSLYRDTLNHVAAVEDPGFYYDVLKETISAHEDVGEGCMFENNAEGALYHYSEVLNFLKTSSWNEEDKEATLDEEARILEKIGDVHIMMKNFEEAEASYAAANKKRTRSDGGDTEVKETKETAAASAANYHKIGFTFESQENYDKALENYNKAIDIRSKWYGGADKEIAKFQYSINSVYVQLGKSEEAFNGFLKVLEIFSVTEPAHALASIEHVNTLKELALMYHQRGDKKKTFELYEKQLTKLQKCNAATINDIIEVLRNMANLLISIGNIKVALKYYELELQMRNKVHHGNEDELAETHQIIGNCYAELGIHDKALDHYEKGVTDDAPAQENLMVYNKIGIQLAKLDNFEESLKFHQRSMLYLHAEESSDIVKMTYNNLASSYQGTLDFEKAHESFELVPQESSKNGETPSYTLYNLGNLFQKEGLLEEAQECFDEFIKIANERKTSPTLSEKEVRSIQAHAYNNNGIICFKEGKYEEASENYLEALKIKTEIFGKNTKEVFRTLCNLGSLMYKIRLFKRSFNYYLMALDICEAIQDDSLEEAAVLHQLGNVRFSEKNYEDALNYYRKAYVMKSTFLQDDSHSDLLLTRTNIGLVLLKFGEKEEALELFKDLYEKKKRNSSEDDPEVAAAKLDIAEAHVALGHLEEAKDLILEAMEVFQKAHLPLKHPYLKRCRKILSQGIKKFLSVKTFVIF